MPKINYKCGYKGKPYMDMGGKIRTSLCKKYGNKCCGEAYCDYIKKMQKVSNR